MLRASDAESLALLYHLNSEPRVLERADPDSSLPAALPMSRTRPAAPGAVELRTDQPTGVLALALSRTSCRIYAARSLSLDHVTLVLRCGYAQGPVETSPDGQYLVARPVPSAGGLYALELYVAVQRIEGLDDGLYLFDTSRHELAPQRHTLTPRELAP